MLESEDRIEEDKVWEDQQMSISDGAPLALSL